MPDTPADQARVAYAEALKDAERAYRQAQLDVAEGVPGAPERYAAVLAAYRRLEAGLPFVLATADQPTA